METVLNFARSELKKYLYKITGSNKCEIAVTADAEREENDAYEISVKAGKGVIRGAGERSALLGVYAFLRETGCRFLAPGEKNEYIVHCGAEQLNCSLSRRYEMRHRGIVIEGDADEDTVEAVADWAVKNGMNSYFIQFEEGKEFFERGLKQEWNPFRESKTNCDAAEIHRIYGRAVDEIKKRGMYYHAMGHGWTCHALGLDGAGWYKTDDGVLSEEDREKLALIGGERKFFGGIPLNTNLCYSDPKAREAFVSGVAEYACAHPAADYLHIWLADNYNNYCECEECAKKLPSEQYVELLNEIDARLTALGSDMKLVFLIYYELLIPPETVRIANPDRFVMMFAPISRSYDFGIGKYFDEAERVRLPKYERNKISLPDTAMSIAYLKKWQKIFGGDSFIFDYPLMWECFSELSGIKLAKTVADDIDGIAELGLDGYMSCQVQKTFFPTGIVIYTLARKLEDRTLAFEQIAYDYFSAAFGPFAARVYDFLESLSDTAVVRALKRTLPYGDERVIASARELSAVTESAAQEIASMQDVCGDAFIRRNLEKVKRFAETYRVLTELILVKADAQNPESVGKDAFEKLRREIYSNQKEFTHECDCMYYCCNFHGIIVQS